PIFRLLAHRRRSHRGLPRLQRRALTPGTAPHVRLRVRVRAADCEAMDRLLLLIGSPRRARGSLPKPKPPVKDPERRKGPIEDPSRRKGPLGDPEPEDRKST